MDTQLEKYFVAVSHITIGVCSVCMYIVYLLSVFNDKSLMAVPYYKITIFMSIADVVQLIGAGLVPAVFLLAQSTGPFWLNKVMGAVLSGAWFVYSFIVHLIAINRFCYMYLTQQTVKIIFSPRNITIMLVIGHLYGLLWLIALLNPYCDIIFELKYFCYVYTEQQLSQIARSVEIVVDVFTGFALLFWYSLVLVKMKLKSHNITNQSIASSTKKLEHKVIWQGSILCFMTCLVIFSWFGVPLITDNDVVTLCTNYVWLGSSVTNVVTYLIFNRKIRRKFVSTLTPRKWRIEPTIEAVSTLVAIKRTPQSTIKQP